MIVGPCVSNVTGMVISRNATDHDPSQGILSTMRSYVRQKGNGVGDAMNRMVEGDSDRADVFQDTIHKALELVAPVCASTVVREDHAVFFDEELLQGFDLRIAHADVLLSRHVDDRRAFPDGKVF